MFTRPRFKAFLDFWISHLFISPEKGIYGTNAYFTILWQDPDRRQIRKVFAICKVNFKRLSFQVRKVSVSLRKMSADAMGRGAVLLHAS